ncbi:16S rRNA (uracil(1498)-N(3))-methyltransferase [Lyngbya aestuarii]|uniref:16S rRNA (uracil(1498)-N(3))-methyltransferase n=1 Tax=Lyngbya aestuarii TaxID=118322 RepID=UPI00403DF29B
MAQLQRLVITTAQRQNQQISLTDAQQHYLCRVLRLESGDRFIAMDGQGGWYISELDTSLTQARIIESVAVNTELPIMVTLIAAMPKGSGFEEVVTQATELGVARIIPTKSDRTLLNPSPQKVERWRRLAQEAAEQSERQVLPKILNPVEFTASLKLTETLNTHRYICVARRQAPHLLSCLEQGLRLEAGQPSEVVIATGPEGGFSSAEVELAIAEGFQAVGLGRRILRAVTAPIVALSLVASVGEEK